jgi:hypothetical protein
MHRLISLTSTDVRVKWGWDVKSKLVVAKIHITFS